MKKLTNSEIKKALSEAGADPRISILEKENAEAIQERIIKAIVFYICQELIYANDEEVEEIFKRVRMVRKVNQKKIG